MQTTLFTHRDCLDHETPEGHPECSDRLRAVLQMFDGEDFFYLAREEAPLVTRDQILRAHNPVYLDSILAMVPEEGHDVVYIDMDTALAPGSERAMLRSAGACVAAVDSVASGRSGNAFCAVRPPGHHANATTAMGFCFLNNAAIAAYHAREVHGFQRVAVIDFDVHHGNGTQDIFYTDPEMFYGSTHQGGIFPGTGLPREQGIAGNIVNAMLMGGAGSDDFRQAMMDRVLPALDSFQPDFLIISAGFDAHRFDPLADFNLTEEDFLWVTRALMEIAANRCGGRIVSTLEGGYDLRALALSTAAHVRGLMGG